MPPKSLPTTRLRRLSSQGSELQAKLLQKSTAGSDKVFGRFAIIASRYPWQLFIIGHVVAVVFCLGLLMAEKALDINDLWIDTDSRVVDEKKIDEEKFGGLGRDLGVAIVPRGAGDAGVANQIALAAHQRTMEDLFHSAHITEGGVNLTESDLCEKPAVPDIFQPEQPTTMAYAAISQCLAKKRVFTSTTWPAFLRGRGRNITLFAPLSSDWGITGFPCNRGSVLDCFKEGGEVDYPPEMKTLEEVAPVIAFAKYANVSFVLATAEAHPQYARLPCWVKDWPVTGECLEGANLGEKITVFQSEARYLISLLPELPPSATAYLAGVNQLISSLNTNSSIIELISAITATQTFFGELDIDLKVILALKKLKVDSLEFQADLTACKRETVAGFISQVVHRLYSADDLDNLTVRYSQGLVNSFEKALVSEKLLLDAGIDLLIEAFASFGYWWRPSYKGLSPEQILEIYRSANQSEANSSITVEQCTTGQLQTPPFYCCVAWEGSKVGMQVFLGNVDKFPNGTFKSVSAYQLAMTNFNSKNRVWKEEIHAKLNKTLTDNQRLKIMQRFEHAVINNYWNPKFKQDEGTGFGPDEIYRDYKVTFASTVSLTDVLDEGTEVDDGPVLISYFVMLAFICITLGKLPTTRNCQELINSHILLGIYGLITVAIATAAGLGFSAYVQMDFTPITSNLAPFVSLGLGVDDMFVLVQSMSHQFKPGETIEANMVRCMHLAGPSVFLTSMANAVAFFIMATTPTTVIYLFGLSAAINVIFNFILLHLIFVPAIVLDTRRMMNNRLDVFLIKVTPTCKVEPIKNDGNEKKQSLVARVFKNQDMSVFDYVASVIGNMLRNPIAKACVLIISVTFTAVMIWAGVDRTVEGLETHDITFSGSYQYDYAVLQENTFPFESTSLVATSANFSDPKTQQAYLDCLDDLSTNRWLMVGPTIKDGAWYTNSSSSLLGYYSLKIGDPSKANTPMPASEFEKTRLEWVKGIGNLFISTLVCVQANNSQQYVKCSSPNSRLDTASVTVYFDNLRKIEDYRDAMRSSRKLVDRHNKDGLKVYLTGAMFYFYEQYLHMSDNALRTTGLTLLGVFFITFIFQFSPMLSLLVCVVVGSVVAELWGFFTIIDIKLNPFSVANLAISVGMAVEFTAHIARAFAVAKGSHDDRMVAALKEMMAPMCQGALSTIVSMAALLNARSPFFRLYYSNTFIVMIFLALLNGIFVLPVLLSLLGPNAFGPEDDTDQLQKEMPAIAEDDEVKVELGEPEWRVHQ